jgi:hypothetical protein
MSGRGRGGKGLGSAHPIEENEYADTCFCRDQKCDFDPEPENFYCQGDCGTADCESECDHFKKVLKDYKIEHSKKCNLIEKDLENKFTLYVSKFKLSGKSRDKRLAGRIYLKLLNGDTSPTAKQKLKEIRKMKIEHRPKLRRALQDEMDKAKLNVQQLFGEVQLLHQNWQF